VNEGLAGERRWVGRLAACVAVVGAFGVLAARPAAADPPEVSGTVAVGGTITVSSDEASGCDGQSMATALRRPTGPNTSVTVLIAGAPLVLGQTWSVQLTIPATDQGGTALTPGMVLVLDTGGICNANGDQFTVQLDDVEVTLGQPVQAPSTTTSTTTSTPAPAQATTTVVAAQPTTTGAAAAAAELPRTGAGVGLVGLAGASFVAVGAVAAGAGRRRASG
jgi:hypothetical protein